MGSKSGISQLFNTALSWETLYFYAVFTPASTLHCAGHVRVSERKRALARLHSSLLALQVQWLKHCLLIGN